MVYDLALLTDTAPTDEGGFAEPYTELLTSYGDGKQNKETRLEVTTPQSILRGLPPLCRVSQQVLQETAPIVLPTMTIQLAGVEAVDTLTHFLEAITNDEGFTAISKIHLAGDFRTSANTVLVSWLESCAKLGTVLLPRCTKLKSIILDITDCDEDGLFNIMRKGFSVTDKNSLAAETKETLKGIFYYGNLETVKVLNNMPKRSYRLKRGFEGGFVRACIELRRLRKENQNLRRESDIQSKAEMLGDECRMPVFLFRNSDGRVVETVWRAHASAKEAIETKWVPRSTG
jgi:hypothetical protein